MIQSVCMESNPASLSGASEKILSSLDNSSDKALPGSEVSSFLIPEVVKFGHTQNVLVAFFGHSRWEFCDRGEDKWLGQLLAKKGKYSF